ncbi:hypothetical protein H4R34_002075 [Dimargaris verticillata]|uniref:Uncharacterized protein n=1 Tax=Dimargaris verticillata TaxID=2761393 RepID=A0A9W8B4F2_9FUNG|nr:hypothetical protein H4R34_002075 [Dimargaris verticillata]
MKAVFGLLFVTFAVVGRGALGAAAVTPPAAPAVAESKSNLDKFASAYDPSISWADDIPENNLVNDDEDDDAYEHSGNASDTTPGPPEDHASDQQAAIFPSNNIEAHTEDQTPDSSVNETNTDEHPCPPVVKMRDSNGAIGSDEEFFDAESGIQTPPRQKSPVGRSHGPVPSSSFPKSYRSQSAKPKPKPKAGYSHHHQPHKPSRFVDIPATMVQFWRKQNLERLCRRVNGYRQRFLNYVKADLPGAARVETLAKNAFGLVRQTSDPRSTFEHFKPDYSNLDLQIKQFSHTVQEVRDVLTHTNPQVFASMFQTPLPRNPSPIPVNQDQILLAKPVDAEHAHQVARNFLAMWHTLTLSYIRVATIAREFALNYYPTNSHGTAQDPLEQALIKQLISLQLMGEHIVPYFGLMFDAKDLLELMAKMLSSFSAPVHVFHATNV